MNRRNTIDTVLLWLLLLLGLALILLEGRYCPWLLGVTLALYLCAGGVAVRARCQETPAPEPVEGNIGWRNSDRQLLGFIERLLKGCDNQRISGVQLPTQSPFFVVFGVDLVDAPSAASELEVCNQLELAFSQHYFWPMNIDGRLICVVNLRSAQDAPLLTDAMDTVVLPAMESGAAALLQEGIPIRIATSGLSVGTESLSLAYQKTIDIFDQLVLTRPDQALHIVVADPRENSSRVDHVTRAQTEKLFNNYIIARELSSAKQALLKLTEYEVQEQEFSLVLKRMTSNRLEWTLDVLTLPPEEAQALREKIGEIAATTYLDELTALIEEWFGLLEATVRAPEQDTLVPKVMTYITENCLNPELNVAMLSEQFHISPSYLSSVFHNQAGIRLIDFIHQQRLKQVKQLLRETDLPIAQIAECTGYYSAMSMSRAFKRYEGVTPTAFRNS